MDDPDLTKLIDYIIACNASLKGAADQYLAALQGMKATSLR